MKRRRTVGIRRLKNQTSRIVDEVRERGRDYVVTRRGQPVAVLRPWRDEDATEERRERARAIVAHLRELARRVAARSGHGGAAGAVSRQRR